MRKCINCVWEGEDDQVIMPLEFCPVCGDNTKPIILTKSTVESKPDKLDFDINKDGKIDNKDIKAMAKKLGKRGGRPKKKKVTKK